MVIGRWYSCAQVILEPQRAEEFCGDGIRGYEKMRGDVMK